MARFLINPVSLFEILTNSDIWSLDFLSKYLFLIITGCYIVPQADGSDPSELPIWEMRRLVQRLVSLHM